MPLAHATNAFTVDFEDWYHGLEIPPSEWGAFEDRIAAVSRRLLQILSEAGVQGTFFILGAVAERHPALVREIAAAWHEVGTHGYSHTLVYRQTPELFRQELRRAVALVEDITGKRVISHRAPFFSITRQSLWALDILAESGIQCDSSIFPVRNYRYGITDAPRWPHEIRTNGSQIREFPISTWRVRGRNVPVAGGAYFRIYPYAFTRHALRSINESRQPFVFYIHPWEIDPEHPRIRLPRRIAATHYFGLRHTERRLGRLLRDFHFAPLREVLHVG